MASKALGRINNPPARAQCAPLYHGEDAEVDAHLSVCECECLAPISVCVLPLCVYVFREDNLKYLDKLDNLNNLDRQPLL